MKHHILPLIILLLLASQTPVQAQNEIYLPAIQNMPGPTVQNQVTDGEGRAKFRNSMTNGEIALYVVDGDGKPMADMLATYEHGGEYEAFFAKNADASIVGFGLFPAQTTAANAPRRGSSSGAGIDAASTPNAPSYTINTGRSVMHAVNDDEEQAMRGYAAKFARTSRDSYVETVTCEELRPRLVVLKTYIIVVAKLLERMPYIGLIVGAAGAGIENISDEDLCSEGQTDIYESYNGHMDAKETVLVSSQAPMIIYDPYVSISCPIACMPGFPCPPCTYSLNLESRDFIYYPRRPRWKNDIIDHTIFVGSSHFSDQTAYYRVVNGDGSVLTNWTQVLTYSRDPKNHWHWFTKDLEHIPRLGAEKVEVYVEDEVGNRSEVVRAEICAARSCPNQ